MKVVLISHPNKYRQQPDFPPIGLAYLGAVAFNANHETLLIDGGLMNLRDIVKRTQAFGPDVIGVTCWTINRDMVWKLCDALHAALPKTILVIGGPHATIFPEQLLEKTHAVAIVLGEGEATFGELLSALDHGESIDNIPGLMTRTTDQSQALPCFREPIPNLDILPRPLYRGFENFTFARYYGFPLLPRPTAPVISSRGCVFDCTFCSSVAFWGRRWRYRSAENVLAEVEWLTGEMGAQSIFFFDDNLPVNKARMMAICEGLLHQRTRIPWACCSHVRMVDKPLLELMKQSGCVNIDFGVESGSEKILKNINKKQTCEDIIKAFTLSHEVGIKPRAYLMVGNPGEDETTIDETIDLIGKIRPDRSVGATLLWLLPGTTVYDDAVKNGYITHEFWLNSDAMPYNLQEHSYQELFLLRRRLLMGIAKQKGGILPIISCYLKNLYYKYPQLSALTSLIPDKLR